MADRHALELSIILSLHESESRVAAATAASRQLGAEIFGVGAQATGRCEILACDQHSHDNTLSVLSLLQSKIPELRAIAEVSAGQAIARGARLARGRWWIFSEDGLDGDLARWAVESLRQGCALALAPGQVLGVTAELGRRTLLTHRGGLISAQARCREWARSAGWLGAYAERAEGKWSQRLQTQVRARLSRFGLVAIDRKNRRG